MFLFISFCTTLLLFRSFEDYLPDYKYLGLLTYFAFIYFQMDMSGLRQAIALNVFSWRFDIFTGASFGVIRFVSC